MLVPQPGTETVVPTMKAQSPKNWRQGSPNCGANSLGVNFSSEKCM